MEEEILNELKTLNEKLSKDLELRSEELTIQHERTKNEKELREIEAQEKEQQTIELNLEKAKAEKRASQIEQYINKLEEQQESEEQYKEDQISVLTDLNNKEQLESIELKLNTISEKMEVTDQAQLENDASYFSSMTIIVFLCFAIPAVATYKFLTRLFDSFTA